MLMFANDPRVMRYCIDQHTSLVEELKTTLGPRAFSTILDFQPLPAYFTDISMEKGGNMLGLERSPRNKIVFASGVTLLTASSKAQYPQIFQKVSAMKSRIKAFSESVGSGEEFIYLPYADASQDPLGSYGATNVEHMKKVARAYDPDTWFQRMVPGGFKIDRVN
jgi:hypothetical protein